jgi:3-carboxy-cis,cis-muconate cycloisomerase
MPQKQNPVGPSALVALARHVVGQAALLQGAGLHRQQRDGAAWFTEWLVLPQTCIALGRMLTLAHDCISRLHPDPAAMAAQMETAQGAIHAEALTFALARQVARPEAEQKVKELLAEAAASGEPLATLALRAHPALDWSGIMGTGLGQATNDALAFSRQVSASHDQQAN